MNQQKLESWNIKEDHQLVIQRSMVELIPPVPFSINQSYNADREKQDAENKENKRQAKNEKFKANAVK